MDNPIPALSWLTSVARFVTLHSSVRPRYPVAMPRRSALDLNHYPPSTPAMKTRISFPESSDIEDYTTDIDTLPRPGDIFYLPSLGIECAYPVLRVDWVFGETNPQTRHTPFEGTRVVLGEPSGDEQG